MSGCKNLTVKSSAITSRLGFNIPIQIPPLPRKSVHVVDVSHVTDYSNADQPCLA